MMLSQYQDTCFLLTYLEVIDLRSWLVLIFGLIWRFACCLVVLVLLGDVGWWLRLFLGHGSAENRRLATASCDSSWHGGRLVIAASRAPFLYADVDGGSRGQT